ncbi:flightin [Microplitis mediator]|uniref:flightin n=1 Tax=Microplitis mediator TaxID=375433 RepID=UPI00255345B8|nr:flightin [Microplitis mediator]XP_057328113.1 flightin [Microplitis mediator]
MSDDENPWDIGDDAPATEETEAETTDTPATGAAAKKEEKVKLDYSTLVKAPKPKYTLHWVRPLFLNYRYLYEYRQIYYNDVIDWMNKRNRGIWRELPNAEEWSERMFRNYDIKNTNRSYKRSADMRWITGYRSEPRYYSYHTRAYYSLKYQPIL